MTFTVLIGSGTVLPSQIGAAATRRSLLKYISDQVHGKVVSLPDIKVDRELAIGVRTIVHSSGHAIAVSYYVPSHFTVSYPLLLANLTSNQKLADQGLEDIVASWEWAG
jgi:hypothetical protein